MTDDTLVAAWKQWDKFPGADHQAGRLEDECQKEAARLGVDATELRLLLGAFVRNGANRQEALERARAAFSD